MTNKCLLPKRRLSSKMKDFQNTLNNTSTGARQPSSATTYRTPVVLFRKINNIKSSCETIQPNPQFEAKYPMTATTIRNPHRSLSYSYKNSIQSDSPKFQVKFQQKFLSIRQSLPVNDDLRRVNNTPVEHIEQETEIEVTDNNNKISESSHDNCLFCKYEKVINENKLPRFATKRIAKIFIALTKNSPEANNLKNEKEDKNFAQSNTNGARESRIIRIPDSNKRGSTSTLHESSVSSF